jgi:hypothetical protein
MISNTIVIRHKIRKGFFLLPEDNESIDDAPSAVITACEEAC